MKIYVKPIFEIKTLEDVIKCLYYTEEGHPRITAHETYLNEEYTKQECREAYRSFEDILVVCRTYFPTTTEEELMTVMVNMGVGMQHCSDINKITFYGRGLNINRAVLLGKTRNGKFYAEGTYTPDMLLDIYERAIPESPKL